MNDLSKVPHHPVLEELALLISSQVRNTDMPFFRILVAQTLCVIASNMRATVATGHRGNIPVGSYTLALSPSGTGKGAAVGMLEEVTKDFRHTFTDHTMPLLAEGNMWKLASKRSVLNDTEEQEEYDKLGKELRDTGPFTYVFADATTATIQQIRHQLQISACGALNLQVDEIGTNLSTIADPLAAYLELYDQGVMKRKLTKNSNDNKRVKEIEGKTPANALMFGTPTKLLDGSKNEDEFYSLLETGYARRFMFAMGKPRKAEKLTPKETYERLKDPATAAALSKWSHHFASLADPTKIDWLIDVPDDVGEAMMAYQMETEELAEAMPDHESVRKHEMAHRYYKCIKLAGAFAFIEEALVMDMSHWEAAMKLVEESGEAFKYILKRQPAYAKLALYLAAQESEMTHPDLSENLPFYKSTAVARTEMMTMATAWGYKNHIIIKKRFADSVELFKGETLKRTDLDAVTLSYSDHFAFNYEAVEVPFSELHNLTQEAELNWTTHKFAKGHRSGETVIPGFNMVVLDIDGSIALEAVHDLMKDFVFMTHTTKRHTPDENRFRLIMPMNYQLELDRDDYKSMISNLLSWLPFEVDEEAAMDQVRKWATNDKGTHFYNLEGVMMDVLPFIPQTTRNEQYRKDMAQLGSLDALERWFAQRFAEGNRNKLMHRFAMALADSGMTYTEVEEKVLGFNAKLSNGLDAAELRSSVLVSVARHYQ